MQDCETLGEPVATEETLPQVPDIQSFIASVTNAIAAPLVQHTPLLPPPASSPVESPSLSTPRRSKRLTSKPCSGNDVVQMAQSVLAKKLGALSSSAAGGSDPFDSCVQRFVQPLSKDAIQVIRALVDCDNPHQKIGSKNRIAPIQVEGAGTA